MTIDDVLRYTGGATTDAVGHIGCFTFRRGGTVALVEARLDKSGGKSPALWKIVWTAHWRTDRGQEQRADSTDLHGLLAPFGPVNLEATPAATLDDLLRQETD